jgi:hypothetical protein
VFARDSYMGIAGPELPSAVTLYYDPLLDVHHRLPAFTSIINTLYLAPQVTTDAQRVFEAAAAQLGLLGGEGPVLAGTHRGTAIALVVTRDWGMDELAARLLAGCEENYQPTWDGDEFWWGFGFDEPHPRGQFNAILAAAEATTPGAWTRLANEYTPYQGPELAGVDLDVLAVRQADVVNGRLLLAFAPASLRVEGAPTTVRVTGLADPARSTVEGPAGTRVDGADLVLELRAADVRLAVTP